ncbi:hypothetical protein DACRYDRAFT_104789 [Dacryopinax primogenitus]|uniref:PIN domain-like protein n=1 Tax=Dacryopinax primogenitus (strain DJM 731) TaxID=1858805 RepID=M5G9H0_DACPD|nr:uncharacterized protein DACRYDRAFT_104789 [Dacryopinax primogenitus]EJU04895.1 hypothetical protein DACRYDRAFT_104789 [Dacryopinax primogenitus]
MPINLWKQGKFIVFGGALIWVCDAMGAFSQALATPGWTRATALLASALGGLTTLLLLYLIAVLPRIRGTNPDWTQWRQSSDLSVIIPVLETLEGKVLAIDSSIWIYQFQATMRDKEGRGLVNAHVLGFLRRICKLLYYGVKPVFVFDGGAPALKRVTITERKKRKRGAAESHAKLAEQLLAAQMRKEALAHVAASTSPAASAGNAGVLDDGTVYLEDYDNRAAPLPSGTTTAPDESRQSDRADKDAEARKKREKYANMDPYALPDVDLEATMSAKANAQKPDPRLATEEEMRAFIDEMRPDDFDITSPAFRELPTEVQYEIIGDLRLRSRQTSYKRLESMLRNSRTSLDFSRAQIQNLKERNSLTQQLLLTAEGVGKVIDHHLTIPVRVASERNREYVLVKNQGAEGGWVLGTRETGTKDAPIVVEDNPVKLEDDEIDLQRASALYDPDHREYMRSQALSALAERYTPKKPERSTTQTSSIIPSFGPAPLPGSEPLFETNEVTQVEDEEDEWVEDEDLAMALEMSMQPGTASQYPDNSHVVDNEEDEEQEDDMELVLTDLPTTAPELLQSDTLDRPDFESLSLSPSPSPERAFVHQTPAEKAGSKIQHATAFVHDTFKSHPLISKHSPTRVSPFISQSPTRPPISPHASESRPVVSPANSKPSTPIRPTSSLARQSPIFASPSESRPSLRQRSSSSPFEDSVSGTPIFRPRSRPTLYEPIPVGALPTSGASRTPLSQTLNSEQSPLKPVVMSPTLLDKGKGPELQRKSSREIQSPLSRVVHFPDAEHIFSPSTELARQPSFSQEAPRLQSSSRPSQLSMHFEREELARHASPSPIPNRSDSVRPSTVESLPSSSKAAVPSSGQVLEPVVPNRLAAGAPLESGVSDEEEEEFAWSRSPSPVHGGEDSQQPPEDWDAAEEMDPEAEENEFAHFMSEVKGKDIDSMQREIDEEINTLNQQRRAALVASEDVTLQMITQIQNMLRLFGIPYTVAPMEAEAQCAELVQLGLVEGIITDDSDVFLFGGLRVFKNMFNQSKTVECFLLSDLGRELSLDRDKLIRLAYLLGSDYVDGLPKVGPVVAMELLREFPGEDGLHKFKEWWVKVQSGKDKPADNATPFRRKFKKRYKDLYLPVDWPNSNVRDAYSHPTVDESTEPFKWGLPDLDAMRVFLRDELGWNASKVDETLLPIIRKVGQRGKAAQANKQGTLTSFFDVSVGTGAYEPRKRQAYSSKRLQKVVSDFRKEQARMEEERQSLPPEDQESQQKKRKAKKPTNGEAPAHKRKRGQKGRSTPDPSAAEPAAQSPHSVTPEERTPSASKARPKPRKVPKGDDEYVPGTQ